MTGHGGHRRLGQHRPGTPVALCQGVEPPPLPFVFVIAVAPAGPGGGPPATTPDLTFPVLGPSHPAPDPDRNLQGPTVDRAHGA